MVASNLIAKQADHAAEMIRFALRAQEEASKVPCPDATDGSCLKMRIGGSNALHPQSSCLSLPCSPSGTHHGLSCLMAPSESADDNVLTPFAVDHRLFNHFPNNISIGIHSGPAMSGIVGKLRRRFCLFGIQ